jgi:plastocyanin
LPLVAVAVMLVFSTPEVPAMPQQQPITVRVEVVERNTDNYAKRASAFTKRDNSNVVIWLTPVNDANEPVPASRTILTRQNLQLIQRNKRFQPHVLVIPAGYTVEFPNKDPFFHNVFSLFDGKRFDLGLYEGGSSSSARFEHPGVSFLFCNIHPEMSAAVVVVDTPYFALSNCAGLVSIASVPDGRYLLHVWSEHSSVDELKNLERVIVVSDATRSLGPMKVLDTGAFRLGHKNKYGQEYTPIPDVAYKRP